MNWRRWDDILGLNARNLHISASNPRAAVRLVNDKAATKQALRAAGIPTSPTLAVVCAQHEVDQFQWQTIGTSWALKPNHGRAGNGILLAAGAADEGWHRISGQPLPRSAVIQHMRSILDGETSNERRDQALFEPLLVPHADMARISWRGLPDVRIICDGPRPILAMARLPTARSSGRANLHQGAIGAAVDLETGTITACRVNGRESATHPDTGERVVGAQVPFWSEILPAATRCSAATGLQYLGVDVVIDRELGPLVLEVNARPGLEIQNVTQARLSATLAKSRGEQR